MSTFGTSITYVIPHTRLQSSGFHHTIPRKIEEALSRYSGFEQPHVFISAFVITSKVNCNNTYLWLLY
jgi:hypothetical protein